MGDQRVCLYCGKPARRKVCLSVECQRAWTRDRVYRKRKKDAIRPDDIGHYFKPNEVSAVREDNDMIALKPGKTTCLRCDREFQSWDIRNNRICDQCKEEELYVWDSWDDSIEGGRNDEPYDENDAQYIYYDVDQAEWKVLKLDDI